MAVRLRRSSAIIHTIHTRNVAVGSQSKCYTVVTGVWIIVVAVWGANSMACLSIRKVAHGLSLLKCLNALFEASCLLKSALKCTLVP